ncbi:hypothetical protein ILUMI_09320 [Ignelater luminosus]|uniref:Farnesol dehydrogenase-like n=1 Tax=Ignelater luminosus TaxID=2038154 RepID=A0A8K0D603_IGNLU|nr:hypothetical protein ILUMI_09320 [Ignelater luminosus]
MERWVGKVAVVTGASSGIGAAITVALVQAGLQVVGLARRKHKIDELAKNLSDKPGKLYSIATDVTKETEIIDAFDWIKNNVGPVHTLINNAGIIRGTNLIDGSTSLWKETFDTNVLGLCIATREALTNMRANKVDGHIIHINSIFGHHCSKAKFFNVYPASKYAVTALTETLRRELNSNNSKIKVTSISPGLVKTDIGLNGGVLDLKTWKEFLSTLTFLNPEDVAGAVMYALATPPHVQIHELTIKPVGERE